MYDFVYACIYSNDYDSAQLLGLIYRSVPILPVDAHRTKELETIGLYLCMQMKCRFGNPI